MWHFVLHSQSYVIICINISPYTYIGYLVSLSFSRDYDVSLLNFHWVQFMSFMSSATLIPLSLISFATFVLSLQPFAFFIFFTIYCTIIRGVIVSICKYFMLLVLKQTSNINILFTIYNLYLSPKLLI